MSHVVPACVRPAQPFERGTEGNISSAWLFRSWLLSGNRHNAAGTTPSGRVIMMPPSCRARSARPEPVRYARACQMLVQPTIGTRSHRPLEVWACPPSPSALPVLTHPSQRPKRPPMCRTPTSAAHGRQSRASHISPACHSHNRPPLCHFRARSSVAGCPSGAVWPQEPRGHVIVIRRLQTRRVYPILHSSTRHHNPGLRSGRTTVNVCALATGRKP